jgi:hemolysin activation/secretion protein
VADGVVEIRIVEGRLGEIEISGNRWLRTSTLRRRLALGEATPLRVQAIEERLQVLQRDEGIRRVQAELVPGRLQGQAILRVHVVEEVPVRAWLDASNYEPPSVGEYRGRIRLLNQSLSGRGDRLELIGGTTGGYYQAQARYDLPLGPWETTLGTWFRYNTSEVVEEPFEAFDIGADSWTLGLGVVQPILRSPRQRLDVWLAAEYRRSQTFLFGEPFSLGDLPASDDGRASLTALRIGSEWIYRDRAQALALRSQLSIGLPILGATSHGSKSVPDGRFVAWLGQLLWARRFDPWGIEVGLRTDVQLASSPLLSIEQYSVGGHASVPGYRENELVRDDAVVASLEVRLPLWRGEAVSAQLVPFTAVGHSWNTNRGELGPPTLASVGIGLRLALTRRIQGSITWGHRLREVPDPPSRDLQDRGVQFEVVLEY